MRRGERFREKGREERDWEGNERERESLEGGRETEREMLGEGNKKGKERQRQESSFQNEDFRKFMGQLSPFVRKGIEF